MKKILFFLSFLILTTTASAQIKLPADFVCVKLDDGYTMANTSLSFLHENLEKLLVDDELITEYLTGFAKSKEGLYIRSVKNKEYVFEVYIPETKVLVSVSTKKDKAAFDTYSRKLKDAVIKNRKKNAFYFTKDNGNTCL